MLAFLLFLFSQVTVTSTGIQVTDADVSKVLTPLTNWAGSFFNVLIAFAGVFVIILFVRIIRNLFKKD